MAKYTVEVRIPITQFQNVTVEANNKEEAQKEAIRLAEIGLPGEWLDDPDSAGDFYIGDVIPECLCGLSEGCCECWIPHESESWEQRRDMIVTHAWETWTLNGLHGDREQTTRSVQDAVANTYVDGISDAEWLADTLERLGFK